MVDQINSNSGDKGTKDEQFTADLGSLSPLAHRATIALMWLARVFAVGIVVQVFLAGLSVFVDAANWASHSSFARYFVYLSIAMIVLSFIARVPVSIRVHCIRLFGMIILMFITAHIASKVGFLGALHPVIALLLFMGALSLAKKAAAYTKA